MNTTPKSMRLQIAIMGKVNVGKSSFLNLITGQDTETDLKNQVDTPYAIASSVLKEHFQQKCYRRTQVPNGFFHRK